MRRAIHLRRRRLAALTAAQLAAAAGSRAIPELAVSAVDAFPVAEPDSKRRYTLIRVSTSGGWKGWGECGDVSARDLDAARRILLGTQASAYEVAAAQMAGLSGLRAAVNMALIDLTAQYAKVPVYQLLAGPTRNKVRGITPLEGSTDAELRASLDERRRAGYRAFLVPLTPLKARNHGQDFVQAVAARLDGLKAAAGEGVDFALDGAGSLTGGDAASLSAALERFHLLWFDEPAPVANLAVLRRLAAENVTPLGFGRTIDAPGPFQDLLRECAIDILRPDIAVHGLTPVRRIAAIAETYYVAVGPRHEGGPVGTAAAIHLAASLPNFFIQQAPYPSSERDRRARSEIAGDWRETPAEGFFELPKGPGLGIRVDEQALARYKESNA